MSEFAMSGLGGTLSYACLCIAGQFDHSLLAQPLQANTEGKTHGL